MWAAQLPFYRRERAPVGAAVTRTSAMLERIQEFTDRYVQLPADKQQWVEREYLPKEALALFLFQVNRIEGEGFDTLQETREAIRAGALTWECQDKDKEALEAVYCLHKAYMNALHTLLRKEVPQLSVDTILATHHVLMSSTKPSIAGRLRKDGEVAFTNTTIGLPHVFVWPTEVDAALHRLVDATNRELLEVVKAGWTIERVAEVVTRFFAEFENVHPFVDGNGRMGRVLVAALLQSTGVLPFPNVLYVEGMNQDPPFVDADDYRECFEKAQAEQEFEEYEEGGQRSFRITKEAAVVQMFPPVELAALVVEGIYVGWKRLFEAVDVAFGTGLKARAWQPKWKLRAS